MKLKYKKALILIFICTLGIGIITIMLIPGHHSKESMNYSKAKATSAPTKASATVAPTATLTQDITVTPTMAPSPTPLPVYSLELKGYPEITKLMKEYYKAKIDCDVKTLKNIFSNPSDVGTKKELKAKVEYYEKYNNIKCYVKKSFKEGTYIVYVYSELKFINIKTPAPAVYQFFVITDSTGNYKIFSGDLDKVTKEYYFARKNDSDVQKLIASTNKKATTAKKKDKNLKTFWNNLLKAQAASDKSVNK